MFGFIVLLLISIYFDKKIDDKYLKYLLYACLVLYGLTTLYDLYKEYYITDNNVSEPGNLTLIQQKIYDVSGPVPLTIIAEDIL